MTDKESAHAVPAVLSKERTEFHQVQSSSPATGINLPATHNLDVNSRPENVQALNTKSRGFLSCLVLIPSTEDARQLDRRIKWLLTSIVSFTALAAPLGSTILMRMDSPLNNAYSATITNHIDQLAVLSTIATDFHTSRTIVNLSIAFYSLAVAFVPLWWSYLSEVRGRRATYLLSFSLLVVFNILAAFSVSIDMFIITRVLAGGACASVQAVGAGTMADLWEVRERGKAMGIFLLGPLLGPLIAPIIGGAVAIKWGWRGTQWAMVIYGIVSLLLMVFFLPETSSVKQRTHENPHNDDERVTTIDRWKATARTAVNVAVAPVKVISMLRFMPVLITVYYTSITFASYYLLNISIQTVFSESPYSFSTLIVGLTYIPSALGSILGSVFGGRWTDYIMRREAIKAGRFDLDRDVIIPQPEDRIHENALVAGLMYPAAMLVYGWTADKHVFWLVPVS